MSVANFLKTVVSRFRSKPIQNMASSDVVQRLESRAVKAENLISVLKAEVTELQKAVDFCQANLKTIDVKRIEEITLENEQLKREIEQQKLRLFEAEKKLGHNPITIVTGMKTSPSPPKTTTKADTQSKPVKEDPEKEEKLDKKKDKKKAVTGGSQEEAPKKAPIAPAATAKGDDAPVDIRRLDIRVGKIVNVKKHPDADSLYVEEVDLGEGKPRTVVSGLVKYVPIEEMENRMVIALCNLKPAKMRGVTSEAMVLCASTPEKVEVLKPPEGSRPGDRVTFEGYPGDPDPVLNPKKKIFETVAPDLKTNVDKVATYKGVPFVVAGKGVVTTQSLTEVQIK